MSTTGRQVRPIIIRRVPESRPHGHHGGGWKVAYADFVTAMMAFFLLLWLVGSADKDTLKGLAEFFSDAKINTGPPGGAGGVLEGFSLMPEPVPAVASGALPASLAPFPMVGGDVVPLGETAAEGGDELSDAGSGSADGLDAAAFGHESGLDAAIASLARALQAEPELSAFEENFRVERAAEGLRIEILDQEQVAMFPVGSASMFAHTRRLLALVAQAVADVPNRVSIRGHTDALQFPPSSAYDNWWLSSDRANATRRVLVAEGLDATRIAEVVGKGDSEPLRPEEPGDAHNRRISILLLNDPGAAIALPE